MNILFYNWLQYVVNQHFKPTEPNLRYMFHINQLGLVTNITNTEIMAPTYNQYFVEKIMKSILIPSLVCQIYM